MHLLRTGILLLILWGSFAACGKQQPEYELSVLEGTWRRMSSTDSRSDSLRISVQGNRAVVVYVPPSTNFVVGELKWIDIKPTTREGLSGRGDFTLKDKSGGSQTTSRATIIMHSNFALQLRSLDFPDAPGGVQEWIVE